MGSFCMEFYPPWLGVTVGYSSPANYEKAGFGRQIPLMASS